MVRAVCLSELGRAGEALKEVELAKAAEVYLPLREARMESFYENDAELERWIEALRKAGFE